MVDDEVESPSKYRIPNILFWMAFDFDLILIGGREMLLTFPNGGCTSKKNVRFMYQLPIFPKCVSSQLKYERNPDLFCYIFVFFFVRRINYNIIKKSAKGHFLLEFNYSREEIDWFSQFERKKWWIFREKKTITQNLPDMIRFGNFIESGC